MTEQPKSKPCFMCDEPTTEIKDYPRIINVNPFPLCKRCQEVVKNA